MSDEKQPEDTKHKAWADRTEEERAKELEFFIDSFVFDRNADDESKIEQQQEENK